MKHFPHIGMLAAGLVVAVLAGAAAAGPSDPVHFADANLEAAVVAKLAELGVYPPLTEADMLALTTLSANSLGITDLTGLEYATNLQYLSLYYNQLTDVSPLAALTSLQELKLSHNQLTDVSPLAGLTSLRELNLGDNQLTDVSPLAGMTSLQHVDLAYNQLTDVSGLAGLTSLETLYLQVNQLTDILPLAGMTSLQWLDLYSNDTITDVSSLAGMTSLVWLGLAENQLTDISPLAGLTNLEYLGLTRNPLDQAAYCVWLDVIASNNPDLYYLYYDPNPNPGDPCVAAVGAEPPADGTLSKVANNCLELTFLSTVSLPVAGPALAIVPLAGGADVGSQFTYTLEPDGVTLMATENVVALTNRTWYRITPVAGFDVWPFELDVCTLIGDANGDGRVMALDLGLIWSQNGQVTTGRCDIDGNGIVMALDLGAAWAHNGETVPDKPAPMRLRTIPGGTFTMGDNLDGLSDAPMHTVTLSSFKMGKYAVTNAQYAEFLNAAMAASQVTVDGHGVAGGWANELCDTTTSSPYSQITYSGGVFGVVMGKDNHPMVRVSWYGADEFCRWYGYRLPTEAEWEYAARGGLSGQRFPWGDWIEHARANYYSSAFYWYDKSPTRGGHPDFQYTSPVGYFAANGYGLCDMAGNVNDWCNDWYDDTYYTVSPTVNPQGPATGLWRVLRGGSWYYGPYVARCAYRLSGPPFVRYSHFGFRVALDLD